MQRYRQIDFTKIASEWDSAPLGREDNPILLALRNGLTTTQNREGGNYKVTRIETISDGFIDEARVRYVSNLAPKELEKYLIQKSDILFSHINSDPHLGKTAIAQKDYDDLLHGMNLLLLRPNPEVIEPAFLNFVFHFYRQIGVFVRICSRAVNQSSINQAKMKALEIPLPSLPEQRKIAQILSTAQKAIEQQDRLIAVTTELKKTLMHKFFIEGLWGKPQKVTEIGPVPESWAVMPLGELLTLTQYGLSIRGDDSAKYPILRMTNQVNGRISAQRLQYVDIEEDEFQKFRLEHGDILFNRTNSIELVGRTAIFDIDGDFVFASYLIRLRTNHTRLNPFFLNHYFNWDGTQARLKSIATRAVSQSNISATRLRGFMVPLPVVQEQEEIISYLDTLDRKIELHSRKRQLFSDLFYSLLHQLMKGQICVNALELEELETVAD